jgi:hypothetical protein
MIVRAINVRQPWATMIFHLGKNIENRSFRLRAPDGSPYVPLRAPSQSTSAPAIGRSSTAR